MSRPWKEVKEQLQDIYPGMSKSVFCMGKNPKYYGVELVERAKRLADAVQPRRENRKNPCEMKLRVSREMYKQVLNRLDGRSFQEYLFDLVEEDIRRQKSDGGKPLSE